MRLIRYREDGGARVAIAGKPGRIYTMLVWIDAPVRVRRVPNGDVERYGQDMPKPGIKSAARSMLRAGKNLGITGGATKHLRAAARAVS